MALLETPPEIFDYMVHYTLGKIDTRSDWERLNEEIL